MRAALGSTAPVRPPRRERGRVRAGSPLTHARFLNRYKGTYGPAISAATGSFPGPATPIKGLYRRAAPAHGRRQCGRLV